MTSEKMQPAQELPYDPRTMIPATVEQSLQLVESFNGQRLPEGHPLNFEKFNVHPGLVILSAKDLEIYPDRQKLWQLIKRISVPAIPLLPGGGRISDSKNRRNWRAASINLGKVISEAKLDEPGVSDFNANPVTVLY